MAHARTQIRQAIVAALTPTGYPVTPGRVYPEGGALPALSVFIDDDEVDRDLDVMNTSDQHRRAMVTVEARVSAVDAWDDAADAVCLDVERALGADVTLGSLVDWSEIMSTAFQRSGESEQPLALATMIYRVEYRVDREDPEILRA